MDKKQKHVRVDRHLYDHLMEIKHQIGIPVTEVARRALWRYLVENGYINVEDVPKEVFLGDLIETH